MRILLVVHYFLPRHVAGTELYTLGLAQALRKEHEVALFCSEIDPNAQSYAVRTREYEGIPVTEVVNNHAYWRFHETYSNPRIEAVFAAELERYRPDVVHLQHLANLSLGLLPLIKRLGIPIVYTLHDYWLTCPRSGLRMKASGELCRQVIPEECASCMTVEMERLSPLSRLRRKLETRWTQSPTAPPTSVPLIEAPPWVQEQTWDIEGDVRSVYAAPPPYHLQMRRWLDPSTKGTTETLVRFFFALHPRAYKTRSDGGVFQIRANGKEIFSRYLCPYRREKDRGWIEGEARVENGKQLLLEFFAKVGPGEDPTNCIAAWGGVSLEGPWLASRPASALWDQAWEGGKRRVEQFWAELHERHALREINRRLVTVQQALVEVDLFLAPSRFLRERFIEFGIPAEKIVYKDYGMDLTSLQAMQRPSKTNRRVVFAYIGTLVEHKGVHVLVEAFNRLDPALAELRIYGDLQVFPHYTARVQALATHPAITFAGGIDNRDVSRILAEVDALVVPSIWFENSPLTIHEALLTGVPVITSRLGGMAELVEHGRTGLLFNPGEVEDLRGQLEWFVQHPQAFAAMPTPPYVAIDEQAREFSALYSGLQKSQPPLARSHASAEAQLPDRVVKIGS
jgi:glycosyltransferase involved in cell wall biosynthesis